MPFSAPGSTFGVLPSISFCNTNSLKGIYFDTKSQSKAINGCLDIFNTSCSQISGMFFNLADKRSKKCKFLFDSNSGLFDIENILTENAESPFVAIILLAPTRWREYTFL